MKIKELVVGKLYNSKKEPGILLYIGLSSSKNRVYVKNQFFCFQRKQIIYASDSYIEQYIYEIL